MRIDLVIQHNFIGYIPPEATPRFPGKDDDETKGYSVDSRWFHPDLENIFICTDPTTADAKWALITSDCRIVNNTAAEIPAFRAVRPVGDQGGHTEVVLADAASDAGYYGLTGLTFEAVPIAGFSFQAHSWMIIRGVPLPPGTWAAGDPGWLQDANGEWGPTPGSHRVKLFTVHKAHSTQGIIIVEIVKGIEMKELDDVAYIDPTIDGQVPAWNNTTDQKYKPTTIESGNDHLTVGYTGGSSPSIDLTVINTICHFPIGVEFGSTTQEYDVSGTTWISAVTGGDLGGIPDEGSGGHALADCLAAITIARDATYLNVREKAGAASPTNPNTIHFLFEDITQFDTIDLRLNYDGSPSHIMAFEFWNYTTSTWSRLGEFTDTGDYIEFSQKVFGSVNFIGTGGDAGKVKLQIIHDSAGISSHSIQFDIVSICDGGGGGGAATQNVYKTFTGDSGPGSTASGPDDSMAVIGGDGIDTTVINDQVSIAVSDAVMGATKGAIIVTLDEGGGTLTTGAKKAYILMPHAGIITSVTLLADQSGSIVVDVWKDSYANFPPTVADSITASAPPTISSAIKSQDSTLTGWTKAFPAGDIFEFNINSATITKCIMILEYDKTGV